MQKGLFLFAKVKNIVILYSNKFIEVIRLYC